MGGIVRTCTNPSTHQAMKANQGLRNAFLGCVLFSWGLQIGDQAMWKWIDRFNASAYYGLISMCEVEHDTPMLEGAIGFGQKYPIYSEMIKWFPLACMLVCIISIIFYIKIIWSERRTLDKIFILSGFIAIVLCYYSARIVIMNS